jgi:hypothetical protein
MGEQGGINLYVYVKNNPVSLGDPLGLWAPDAHDYIIEEAFKNCLTGAQRQKLEAASAYVDGFWNGGQLEFYSYQHGMRGGSKQSEVVARQAADNFIELQELLARRFASSCKNGYQNIPLGALWEIGQALHTIMDKTSPAHEGFQIWNGPPYTTLIPGLDAIRYTRWYKNVLAPHQAKETLQRLQGDSARLQRVKKDVRDEFAKVFGDCGCCTDD